MLLVHYFESSDLSLIFVKPDGKWKQERRTRSLKPDTDSVRSLSEKNSLQVTLDGCIPQEGHEGSMKKVRGPHDSFCQLLVTRFDKDRGPTKGDLEESEFEIQKKDLVLCFQPTEMERRTRIANIS